MSDQSVKIRSSLAIFGKCDCHVKSASLGREFLKLQISYGNANYDFSLSFKHIHQVEFVDNSENKGAGLIIFINGFMSEKIQSILAFDRRHFADFRTPYSQKVFIVMDILNSDPHSINSIRRMLDNCDQYHRQYVAEMCLRSNKNMSDAVVVDYISVISFSQWKTMLSLLGKEITLEEVEIVSDMQRPVKYTVGRISDFKPAFFSIKSDGRIVPSPRLFDDNNRLASPSSNFSGGTPTSTSSSAGAMVGGAADGRDGARHKSRYSDYGGNSQYFAYNNSYSTNRTPRDGSHRFLPGNRPSGASSLQQQYAGPNSPYHSETSPAAGDFQYFPSPPVPTHQPQQQARAMASSNYAAHAPTPKMTSISYGQPATPQSSGLFMSPPPHTEPPTSSGGVSGGAPSSRYTVVQRQHAISANQNGGTPLTRRVPLASQKREIHVIEDVEDDEVPANGEGLTSLKKRNDTIFVYPASGTHGCSVHYADLKFLDYSYMLNDTIIDFYLKYIYHELVPPERRKKIFMFNSFFYSRLSQVAPNGRPYIAPANRWKRVAANYPSIKSWTKKVNLFSMDYVVVPINEDIHWYLAIIVNPSLGIINSTGAMDTSEAASDTTTPSNLSSTSTIDNNNGDNSTAVNASNEGIGDSANTTREKPPSGTTAIAANNNGPFVVVFDSLIDGERKHSIVRDLLAEYLVLEYADKKTAMNLPGDGFSKDSIRLVTPTNTPQQKNYVDCGVFLLKFAEIFMTKPPKISSTCVSFCSWYPQFQIKGKREEIKSLIRRIATEVKYADFLPPNATPMPAKKGKKRVAKKAQLASLGDIIMPPLLTRRHSDTSIREQENEQQFTSLGMNSLSRSLDSILEELKGMPPLLITFRDRDRL